MAVVEQRSNVMNCGIRSLIMSHRSDYERDCSVGLGCSVPLLEVHLWKTPVCSSPSF